MLLIKEQSGFIFDDHLEEAVKVCAEYDIVSAALLQRKLHIGYVHAGRLIDQMSSAGIVGPANGLGPKKLLLLKDTTSRNESTNDTKSYLLINSKLITELLEAHGIYLKLVRVIVQKMQITIMFDVAVGTKIDGVLKLDKEIASILASPTGKVEMGCPYPGTSLLYINMPTKTKMKEEKYIALDIDPALIKLNFHLEYRAKIREALLRFSGFLDELAYRI